MSARDSAFHELKTKRKKGFHLLSSEDKNIDLVTTAHQGTNETNYFSSVILYPTTYYLEYGSKHRVWNSRDSRLHLTLAGLVTRYIESAKCWKNQNFSSTKIC